MKRTVRNYIIRIAIIGVFTVALILVASKYRPSWAESSEQRADREIVQNNDLTLWYYDEDLTPYVDQLKADYFRKEGLRVGCELVSVVSFFEKINERNVNGSDSPDLYIIDTTRLEQAYLGSLAKQNAYPELYTLANYSVKSLTSILYGGKQVAYPLCFDMEYFVYNKDYMEKAPLTFTQISNESESFTKQADSPVDMVILYDISDLLFNYHFIGGSIDLGGEAGDDDTSIRIDSESLLSALEIYKSFAEKAKINMSRTTYDLVENSFVFGRSMCSILKCSSLEALNREHTNYEIAPMPQVSAQIGSNALSTTFCVCVNPMSKNVSGAEELAKYMTYDNTSSIYSLTGFMSCKRMDYSEAGFDEVYALYDDTASLPKFLETEELWRDMKKMLNQLAGDPETNSSDVLSTFVDAVYSQLATRTGQEHK